MPNRPHHNDDVKKPLSVPAVYPAVGDEEKAAYIPDEGIEILVKMAKTGEIDPWNVDIVKVADQYLQAVAELKESDLKITGKVLLYLAVLLRMKSDQLAGIDYLEPPEEELLDDPLEDDFMSDMDGNLINPFGRQPKSLEDVLVRRTSAKQPRVRRVTLTDLIGELKRYEELEKRRLLRDKVEKDETRRRVRDYSNFTADDIEEMAHEEFIEDTILSLKHVLGRILIDNANVSMTELIQEGNIDKVSAFLALLFLSARGEVDMHQDEFYSEIYVGKDETGDVPLSDLDSEDASTTMSPDEIKKAG
ncbi:MAG: segregation/condensation protein A [Vampirovibrio sp.]|nr:segregation/condensation protein A [Vampirovibrio sp.]